MTSSSFKLIGSVSQIGIGTSTAATHKLSGGFLYYPAVTVPTLTPTAGDGQVSFAWNVAVGFLGWTVSNYNIGQATISGGPYTYTSVGSTTSATISGLANGTTYYFVIRPEDAFGNSLATSSEVSATPVAASTPASTPTTVGGGGILGVIIASLKPFVPFFPEEFLPPPTFERCPTSRFDLNCDGVIGLQDFSIFVFLTPRPAPNPADFNEDGVTDLRDMSGLFFEWTEPLLTFIEPPKLQPTERREETRARSSLAAVGSAFAPEPKAAESLEIQQEFPAKAPSLINMVFEKVKNFGKALLRGFLFIFEGF